GSTLPRRSLSGRRCCPDSGPGSVTFLQSELTLQVTPSDIPSGSVGGRAHRLRGSRPLSTSSLAAFGPAFGSVGAGARVWVGLVDPPLKTCWDERDDVDVRGDRRAVVADDVEVVALVDERGSVR